MDKYENPAHGDNREREIMEKDALAGMSPFQKQNTTKDGLISSILSGSENPMTAQEIMAALDVPDPRLITKAIERERRAGVPICASNDGGKPGYYLAFTADELERYTRSLNRRVKSVSRTLAALEEIHDKWTGQECFDMNGGDLK